MLKSNKLNLLISIVCAIVLWAYITTVVNPETERTVTGIPVDLTNIEALNYRGFTVNESISYLVDVSVRGSRSEVAKLTPADFRATADITGYRKGVASVPVNIVMPPNFELVDIRPENIQVDIVNLITVNKPVRLEYEDTFPSGMEPGSIIITPEEMEVSGIADVVDSIDYIRAIVPEGSLSEEVSTFRLDVVAINKNGEPVHNVGLSHNSVEVTAAIYIVKRVPLRIETIGEPNENAEITDLYIPGNIVIRGAMADIEEINEIEGRPIDLSDITYTEEIPIEPYLHLPEGVELANASQNLSIRIEVQGISKKEFIYTADMIELRDLAPTLSGHVKTGSVTVIVLAPQDVLERVTQYNVKLFVDVSGYSRVGLTSEFEVETECGIEEIRSITVEPAKVQVTINRD